MRLGFYGAAGEVTGSCYLVQTDRARVLVDFGMHQGEKEAFAHNRRLPPVDRSLSAMVLTHAHIDHCGRLPLLPGMGYRGQIHCTPATAELTDILLKDAARLQEADAERVTLKRLRAGRAPVRPLYGEADVPPVMKLLSTTSYGVPREVAPGITITFHDAGHILGAAIVEMDVREGGKATKIVFSADIGPKGMPLVADPTPLDRADVLILESTYGDRDHPPMEATVEEFARILAVARTPTGKVLVPAFAVGRTQQMVYYIGRLRQAGKIPPAPVFIDSPMAIEVTSLYRTHRELMDEDAAGLLKGGDPPLSFNGLSFTRTREQSMAINAVGNGAVVIAASGMCTGGRILHHLKHGLWRPETHVVFCGFQAQGTLGRRIADGQKTVKVMGEPVAVKSQIHMLSGFSAHAGQSELMEWGGRFLKSKAPPRRVFLTHGEPGPRGVLRDRLRREFLVEAGCPGYGETVDL